MHSDKTRLALLESRVASLEEIARQRLEHLESIEAKVTATNTKLSKIENRIGGALWIIGAAVTVAVTTFKLVLDAVKSGLFGG